MSSMVDAGIAAPGSIGELVSICKEACDSIAPMVRTFYHAINGETAKLKADKSVFTIADGIVQHLLVEHLLAGGKLKGIVGEEDAKVNITTRPYTVDDLTVPDDFCDIVDETRTKVAALAARIHPTAYKTNTAFIDPIDGTREFATGLGEQCTILVGFSNDAGKCCGGMIYRPIPDIPVWAVGCKAEGFRASNIELQPQDGTKRLVTTNGSISKFVEGMLAAGMERVKSGGAGNKVLWVLEGHGTAYISDRGVSRWDTCGPEGVIDAFGGCLFKLNSVTPDPDAFLAAGTTGETYTYLRTDKNLDFVPGQASLTPYNVSTGVAFTKGDKKKADEVTQVKAYANTAGLVALSASELVKLPEYVGIIKAALAAAPPSFD